MLDEKLRRAPGSAGGGAPRHGRAGRALRPDQPQAARGAAADPAPARDRRGGAHDVYLRVWDRAASYDPSKGSAMARLVSVARNAALDHFRRHRREVLGADDREAEDAAVELADLQDFAQVRLPGGCRPAWNGLSLSRGAACPGLPARPHLRGDGAAARPAREHAQELGQAQPRGSGIARRGKADGGGRRSRGAGREYALGIPRPTSTARSSGACSTTLTWRDGSPDGGTGWLWSEDLPPVTPRPEVWQQVRFAVTAAGAAGRGGGPLWRGWAAAATAAAAGSRLWCCCGRRRSRSSWRS